MFTIVQPHEIPENQALLRRFFQLRKRVFFDGLHWSVQIDGEIERDAYDDASPTYLLWVNAQRTEVYGGLRLMPTTGPTLVHDVFFATHGRNPDLIASDLWEGTRMCLDEKALARDMPGLTSSQAFDRMFVALCEAALRLGIRRMVSNFEACMSRIYRRAGLSWSLNGQADGYGARPVYCAVFDISADVLDRLRHRHGLTEPLLKAGSNFRAAVPAPRQTLPLRIKELA